jgi:transcriptional regulator with XRE-family HTH domain
MDPLDYDPTYPKNPKTLGEYIRKFRKDKGLTMEEFAREVSVAEDTVEICQPTTSGRSPHFSQIMLTKWHI